MPDAPIQSSLPMPSSQISAAGAVVAAVEQSGALGSIGNTLGATGLIDATANQVSGLGGIGGTREGARVIHTDGREVHRIWQLNGVIDPSGSRHSYSWQPEGLTGFSLRHTFAEDAIGDGKAQVVLESLVRERTLIVRMTSTELPGHPTVVDYRVMQADGRPLPVWLDRVGSQVLMGERPANSEVVSLRVVAILSDGSTIERNVLIQTTSGEIQPLASGKRSEFGPAFDTQIERHAASFAPSFDQLTEVLASAGMTVR